MWYILLMKIYNKINITCNNLFSKENVFNIWVIFNANDPFLTIFSKMFIHIIYTCIRKNSNIFMEKYFYLQLFKANTLSFSKQITDLS